MSFYSRTIGWARADRDTMIDAMFETYDQNLAAKELGMFNWQWNARARSINLASEKIIAGRLNTQLHNKTGPVYSALNQLIAKMIPDTQQDRFAMALNYAETDDKISGIIETQVDFGMSGFRIAAKDAKAEAKISDWQQNQRIYNLLLEGWNTAASADNVVIMLQTKTKVLSILPLPNLIIVPTHSVDSKGRKLFRTFLRIPDDMKKFIQAELRANGESARSGALKGIPEKWIKVASLPFGRPPNDPNYPAGGYVELGEPGSNEKIYILNRKGVEDRLIEPSMMTVFPSIELRQLLQDGEFSIAYLIKFFIHQIKIGPKAEGKNLAQVLRAGKIGKAERDEVKSRYRTKVDKAFFEVTDQTLEHVFHFPGSDVDMGPRYATPDARIEWWARISQQIVVGSNGNYSGGLIYLKGYSRKISRFRDLFSQFLSDILEELLREKDAEIQWDEHYMKEPRQKLAEVTFMVQHGMDMQTASRILGYSFSQWISDREKTLSPEVIGFKTDEKKKHLYWQAIQIPFFEVGAGLLTDDKGGRPPIDDSQTDDNNSEPTARPGLVAGAEGQDV